MKTRYLLFVCCDNFSTRDKLNKFSNYSAKGSIRHFKLSHPLLVSFSIEDNDSVSNNNGDDNDGNDSMGMTTLINFR